MADTTAPTQNDPFAVRSFSQLVGLQEEGTLNADLTAILREVIAKCTDHARNRRRTAKGAVTLKIDLSVDEAGVVEIVADATSKLPKGQRGRSVYWATADGNLSRQNPTQPNLPGVVRTLDGDRAEVRSV